MIVDLTVAIAELTIVQQSIRQLNNNRFNPCATTESTLVQPSKQRLYSCRIDACATVDLMLDFNFYMKAVLHISKF